MRALLMICLLGLQSVGTAFGQESKGSTLQSAGKSAERIREIEERVARMAQDMPGRLGRGHSYDHPRVQDHFPPRGVRAQAIPLGGSGQRANRQKSSVALSIRSSATPGRDLTRLQASLRCRAVLSMSRRTRSFCELCARGE